MSREEVEDRRGRGGKRTGEEGRGEERWDKEGRGRKWRGGDRGNEVKEKKSPELHVLSPLVVHTVGKDKVVEDHVVNS